MFVYMACHWFCQIVRRSSRVEITFQVIIVIVIVIVNATIEYLSESLCASVVLCFHVFAR